jgi:hypothetical protein
MFCLCGSFRKFILIISIFSSCLHLEAQNVKQPLSVGYVAMGANSNKFSDIFSATSNQASLANLKGSAFAVYGEKRFMLDDLNGFTAIVGMPTTSGSFGFQADYFGSSLFNENELGLIYARKISKEIEVGAKFNYHTVKAAGYGSLSAVNFEAGAIFHLTEKLHSGIHVYNPAGRMLGKTASEKLASIYCFGLGYEVSEKLFLSSEIIKQEDMPIGARVGVQYDLHSLIFIRSGISTVNNSSYTSVGINVSFGRIDLNTSYHPQLGFSPGILLLINLKKREGE